MLWLLLIVVVIGVVVYIADKKIKAKFEDKFNPNDWDLPGSTNFPTSADLSADTKPQVIVPVVNHEKISYEKKSRSLSHDNSEIFKAIRTALNTEYTLLTNINATDVLAVVTNNNALVSQVAVKNIATKQFDFVVCENESLKAVCVITLGEVIEPVLINACESAQLPIARFRVQESYDPEIIRASIFQALGVSNNIPEARVVNYPTNESALNIVDVNEEKSVEQEISAPTLTSSNVEVSSEKEAVRVGSGIDLKLCPNCSAVMLKRKAKNGANAGQLFWICSTYPNCRGILAIK